MESAKEALDAVSRVGFVGIFCQSKQFLKILLVDEESSVLEPIWRLTTIGQREALRTPQYELHSMHNTERHNFYFNARRQKERSEKAMRPSASNALLETFYLFESVCSVTESAALHKAAMAALGRSPWNRPGH